MTSNDNTTQDSSSYSVPENTAIVAAYFLISVFAVPANGLVIFVMVKVRAMHNSTSIVLLNLCVADLLIALLYVPFTTIDLYVQGYWVFGEAMCRLVSFVHSVAVTALVLFLVAIAVERYRHVCLRGCPQLTIKRTWFVVAILWLLASLGSCPQLVIKHLIRLEETGSVCVDAWPSPHAEKAYTLVTFALFYLIPLAFLTIIYFKIARKLWRSTIRTKNMRRARPRATYRLTRISVALVLSFALLWAPSHVLTLWYYLRDPDASFPIDVVRVLYPIVSCTASSSCAFNPLVYCFMSHKFRASLGAWWERSSRSRVSRESDWMEARLDRRLSTKTLEKNLVGLEKGTENLENVPCVYCIYESNV